MKVDKKEIKKLASLSKIKLSEKEIEKFTKDMDIILSSVKTLENFDEKLKERKLDEIDFEELRDDTIKKGLTREEVLYNAPYTEDGYVKVYK